MKSQEDRTRIIPLGGVGEFGANATIIDTLTTTILVDFGIMFPPDTSQPGVDFYINDPLDVFEYFPAIDAILITHGHEDHVGGVRFLLEETPIPIYTTAYTAELAKQKCEGLDIPPTIEVVERNQRFQIGDITCEFIGVTHSIVAACALAIETPSGTILHSGDFKVDPLPGDGWEFQSQRLRELGQKGVDLLIMDSTNAFKRGFCPAEDDIVPDLEKLIGDHPGRVFVTTFASNMPRIRKLEYVAQRLHRKIAFVGRSFYRHYRACMGMGYLDDSPDVIVPVEKARHLPPDEVLYFVTGSQGEGRAALNRIAKGNYMGLDLDRGDLVIFSSKAIPGNERAIALLSSQLQKLGVKVVTEKMANVHTSGHAYQEDLAYMVSLLKPRNIAPIHGEYAMLRAHFNWLDALVEQDVNLFLIQDGDVLSMQQGELSITDSIQVEMLPIDGQQDLPIDWPILKARKNMMYVGFMLIVVRIDPYTLKDRQVRVETIGMVEPEPGHYAERVEQVLQGLPLPKNAGEEQLASFFRSSAMKALRALINGKPEIRVVLNDTIHG